MVKIARAKTILASHCKTFAFQGCSPCSAKVSSAAEEETTLMMFSLLQEQHKAKLKLMAAANKQAMDTMFERMNALITGHGKAVDKVTAPISNSNTGHVPSTTNCNKKRCTNCRKLVSLKLETCYELRTNRYPGWKSCKNASVPV